MFCLGCTTRNLNLNSCNDENASNGSLVNSYVQNDMVCYIRRISGNAILYTAVNFAGMYTKYLTDRSQRKAFLETHRSMETRYRTQNENERQEKLLLSGKKRVCFHSI